MTKEVYKHSPNGQYVMQSVRFPISRPLSFWTVWKFKLLVCCMSTRVIQHRFFLFLFLQQSLVILKPPSLSSSLVIYFLCLLFSICKLDAEACHAAAVFHTSLVIFVTFICILDVMKRFSLQVLFVLSNINFFAGCQSSPKTSVVSHKSCHLFYLQTTLKYHTWLHSGLAINKSY